jgi:hypothetical protein
VLRARINPNSPAASTSGSSDSSTSTAPPATGFTTMNTVGPA